eukprot:TRINITY_DN1499_c0_g1_i2.p1 TRINITY_DN1499_c0_g1~~TRINITY_DN1499_c0_g1_i2.p1  ORF type:complete len:615 (+),score=148.63 TRINITY_DN1499_c0_g1_i2:68-1846(+)
MANTSSLLGIHPPAPTPNAPAKKPKPIWLDGWNDPFAGVSCWSQTMVTGDFSGNNDFRLVVADECKKVKIFGDTAMVDQLQFAGLPTAVISWYASLKDRIPLLAVATGPYLYLYHNLRPHWKFTLPPMPIAPEESDAWASHASGRISTARLGELLEACKDQGTLMTARALDFISLETSEARDSFLAAVAGQPLEHQTVTTTMTVLRKTTEESAAQVAVSCPVIGTESRQILILDPSARSVLKRVQLSGVPSHIVCVGTYDGDYRIVCALRHGGLVTVRDGDVVSHLADVEAPVCGLVRVERLLVASTMAKTLIGFHLRGRRQFVVNVPSPVQALAPIAIDTMRAPKAYVVALENRELRVYAGKVMLNSIRTRDVVSGMLFGRYAREDGALVLAHRSGGVAIKVMSRFASLEGGQKQPPPPLPKIDFPKKTTVWVEQCERERTHAIDIHRAFQRDLCHLRLRVMRQYVAVVTAGGGASSLASSTNLRITVTVVGMGPRFKLQIALLNTSTKAAGSLDCVVMSSALYEVEPAVFHVPFLPPALGVASEVDVTALMPDEPPEDIRVVIVPAHGSTPVVAALVRMPAPEVDITAEE